jgi:transcriptional regulator of acetoin/glycerol metabolism
VRRVIADSWRRSRDLGIGYGQVRRPIEVDARQFGSRPQQAGLLQSSLGVVRRLAERLAGTETAVLVADKDGLIIVADGDPSVLRAGERLGAASGANWSEQDAGTSGIGTVLTTGQAIQVLASEHYCEGFKALACTGAPIRHPLTRQVLGVLTLASACERTDLRLLQLAVDSSLAITHQLRDRLVRNDHVLLESLSEIGESKAAYAVDLSGHRTMLNQAAMRLVAPADWATLSRIVERAMEGNGVWRQECRLENRGDASVQVRPLHTDEEPVGAIVTILEERAEHRARRPDEDWRPFDGRAQRTIAMLRAARRLCRTGSRILIVGEAGTGKSSLIAAMRRNGGWPKLGAVLDCARHPTPDEVDLGWLHALSTGLLVLERVHELDPAAQGRLLGHIDVAPDRDAPRVRILSTATASSVEKLRESPLRSDLLDRLAVDTIQVPSLRDRRDEIPQIVRRLLREVELGVLPMGEQVRPDAMRALQRYGWPGNVRQLRNVLHTAMHVKRGRPIEVRSLPGEIAMYARSAPVHGIEEIELEAIFAALRDCGGKVTVAAEQLGVSRATVYRRLRAARSMAGN